MSRNAAAAKYKDTPLRQAQRELTRSRIRDAARDLFYELHYDATTVDQIAGAAGLTRSTLYLHYRDKAEILADITADYAPRAVAQMERLPGPNPSLAEIDAWLLEVVDFVTAERVPLAIVQETGRSGAQSLEPLLFDILEALGRNNPAFARAARRERVDLALRARATLLIGALTYACNQVARGGDRDFGTALLLAVAESFQGFIVAYN
ncbi:MAG: transcriptional regulator, TetR family [Caulobacteraceae bacterium]|jgi:AcrR family transcriptional regulator|nr:transcriptional regulator, TetR family [Caulobacteraceae bacterium]